MADLEETVKDAETVKNAKIVEGAEIVEDAFAALTRTYSDNVVSVFRPGSKNPTSDYDMMVVMKDGINIQEVSERIKKQLSMYSKEKAFKDVHFFVHRRSDYDDVHNFKTPVVVEPASIENWRGLAPTYQFAWEIRTTDSDNQKAKEVYVGEEFVREQKPKAVNLHANRGEGLELVLTQTRSMLEAFEAPEDERDSRIAKAVLRATAGIYLALEGVVKVTDEELASIKLYDEDNSGKNKERFLYEVHQKAKKIRKPNCEPSKETFKDSGGEFDLNVFKIFETAMKAAVRLASKRPDYVWSKKRKERMEDYYAHNTEKLIWLMAELTEKDGFVSHSPLAEFGAQALLWYVKNCQDKHDKTYGDAIGLLEKISARLKLFARCPAETEEEEAEAASRQLLLAEIKPALGEDAKDMLVHLDEIKTVPYGFNPDLSEIKARIFRQQGDYAKSVREDPKNAETWKEWSDAAPEQEKLYSAIASALERNDLASLVFGVHGEAAKDELLRPWQKKLIHISEDARTLAEKLRTEYINRLNAFEGLEPPTREFEEMIRLLKAQILIAENFVNRAKTFENQIHPDAYLGINQSRLERMISTFWQQFDLLDVRYATANKPQQEMMKEPGPEMLELASTSAKRSALHFSYASIATAALAGASLTSFVPGSLQLYLQGATAIALPVLLATGMRFASDIELPRNVLRLKQALGR